MGEVFVTDYPEQLPSKCANCGASQKDGRKYIDWGMSEDFYGTFYLCSFCLAQIVRAVGEYVPREDFEDLEANRNYYRESCYTLQEKVNVLDSVISNYESLRSVNGRLSRLSDFNSEINETGTRSPHTDVYGSADVKRSNDRQSAKSDSSG